ncbi:MAG: polymer-forming cytoskeletal protein [Chitinivibrionales bacterium]|nr:polymer-forming cytoskeletal protein [Chitinivibrionales bacterium]
MDKVSSKGHFSIFGEGTHFEGTVNAPHSIRIEGSFKGKIQTTEDLSVGASGHIEAEIHAKNAIIGGKVVGNITVENRIELEANSSLIGDLKARDLIINEGAVFHGNCSMNAGQGEKV